ncbi:MAG: anaerobic glycerol-3-phosphate dehydrogenase subunit B [Anaerolineales bacterium]|nr:MAG: anaerobic glycerol-3-phosphate dehydrogenase subunit B [Anaerolineales bacterium]
MTVDLLIIGAGLSGLFASNLAIDRGLSVHVVASGRGGLSVSHGCIDIYKTTHPTRSIRNLHAGHPYRVIPGPALKKSVNAFHSIVRGAGLDYQGVISTSIPLLSALGTPFRTSLVPASMIKGRLDDPRPILIAGLENYRDFWPEQLAQGAEGSGISIQASLMLPMPYIDFKRDTYATDIANMLRDRSYRLELWRAWKPKLSGKGRVGIPAILGLTDSTLIQAEAEEFIGVDLFEIPSLPASLPGLRLEHALIQRSIQSGVDFTEGPSAIGRIDGRSKGRRSAGIQIVTTGGLRAIDAKAILLATGGFLHGGLRALQEGNIIESVFGLPIQPDTARELWTRSNPWDTQPFSRFGLATDQYMRPLDRNGKLFLENVFACGGVLGGADRTYERSRQGIDLATTYHAIESILNFC